MRRVKCWVAVLCGLLGAAHADEAALRFSAPIEMHRAAAFVQLPLPASAYAHSQQAGLNDLRVIDARGERVPFALLGPRANEAKTDERSRPAVLYPLPPRPAAGGTWPSPAEITVDGDRISVKRQGGAAGRVDPHSAGWLLDLGERRPKEPAPQSLKMQWSGPAEFSVAFDFEMSDDLRAWRPGGSGQLMALASASGALTQPRVMLPTQPGRFIRLVWSDSRSAPLLTGAQVVVEKQRSVAVDVPTELRLAASPEPAGKTPLDEASKRALHFDLGGLIPVVQVDLLLAPGTHVAPVRVQGRQRVDAPWQDIAPGVFYRLERGGNVNTSPPLSVLTRVHYLRLVPDERAAALDAAQTRLIVQAQLGTLVFANQGQAPYRLLVGSATAPAGALPATTLVPALDEERPRFGQATLGEWSEVTEVARQAEAQRRRAALRPWLLWSVLLAGVGSLAFMVWRLMRGPPQVNA